MAAGVVKAAAATAEEEEQTAVDLAAANLETVPVVVAETAEAGAVSRLEQTGGFREETAREEGVEAQAEVLTAVTLD